MLFRVGDKFLINQIFVKMVFASFKFVIDDHPPSWKRYIVNFILTLEISAAWLV